MIKSKFACVALLVAIAGSSTGCVVRARGQVSAPVAYVEVEEEPPPPRVWVRETRPGYVYIQGRWNWSGGRWVWADGRWESQRQNQYWTDGRWERRGRGHAWVEGRWSAGNNGGNRNDGPVIRDHRDNGRRNDPPPAPQPGNAGGNSDGPVIRDHRR